MAMPSSRPSPPSPPPSLDLDLTIISAKHLKNVNWKNEGTLKPYAIFWVDPDNKLTTRSDDSGHTKPVWNQKFLVPIPSPLSPGSTLSLELFHSKASEAPKPFIGSLSVPLSDLPDPTNPNLVRTYDVLRPSGRPQGKIRLKMSLKERPVDIYQNAPAAGGYYYSSAPPYPTPSYGPTASSRSATGYPYSVGYYYQPPPPPPPALRRESGYGGGALRPRRVLPREERERVRVRVGGRRGDRGGGPGGDGAGGRGQVRGREVRRESRR